MIPLDLRPVRILSHAVDRGAGWMARGLHPCSANPSIMVSGDEILIRGESGRPGRGQTATATGHATLRVWLVDDNQEFSMLLADLLVDSGDIECPRYFPSAEAVLQALTAEAPPDVILLDNDMGGMSGLDAIRPIKSLASSTRVFMLTAFHDSHRRAQALRDGATDFLLKIDTLEKISKKIRQTQQPADEPVPAPAWGESGQAPAGSGSPDSSLSYWPKRRAPESGIRRSSHDDVTQQHPEQGRRSVPWRSASSRLVRGVGFLRNALGLG